jgi:5-methylthioadenosine/S-adenosylhomocysteine deaminase
MRAVLAQGIIDFPAPGVPDPKENIKIAVEFVEKWRGLSSVITPSIFCHSPYTCSDRTLKAAKAVADENGLLFQIHAAETKNEWAESHSIHQTSPIGYLDRMGVLDSKTLLVHCVWVDEEDIRIIVDRGANVSHNPESNMKLASGIAPVPGMLESGVTLGLGTDGCASNNNLDLFQEMDTTAKLHKVNTLDSSVVNAREVLEMATIGGAKAIGLGDHIGSIQIGKQADLIVVETDKPHMAPMYNPVSHLVYAARGSDVRDVVVAGKILLRNRRMLTVDVDAILYEVGVIADRVGRG